MVDCTPFLPLLPGGVLSPGVTDRPVEGGVYDPATAAMVEGVRSQDIRELYGLLYTLLQNRLLCVCVNYSKDCVFFIFHAQVIDLRFQTVGAQSRES